MADILLTEVFNLNAFTWGSASLTDAEQTRKIYITALKEADKYDYSMLKHFVRS